MNRGHKNLKIFKRKDRPLLFQGRLMSSEMAIKFRRDFTTIHFRGPSRLIVYCPFLVSRTVQFLMEWFQKLTNVWRNHENRILTPWFSKLSGLYISDLIRTKVSKNDISSYKLTCSRSFKDFQFFKNSSKFLKKSSESSEDVLQLPFNRSFLFFWLLLGDQLTSSSFEGQ